MTAKTSSSPGGKASSRQIDAIIESSDWKGKTLSQLRALIKKTVPGVIEEVKWKRSTNPSGVPIWSHDGIICTGGVLRNAAGLTFPKGAQMKDPKMLFNACLEGNSMRAIDFHRDDTVDEAALKALILEVVKLNTPRARRR